jgi:hypothetical protein
MDLPRTVRFIRLGTSGMWVERSFRAKQLHAGWRNYDRKALLENDPAYLCPAGRAKGKSLRDDRELQHLLDAPSRHIWVTTYAQDLWWTLVHDGLHFTTGESKTQGNFYLTCRREWSNLSLGGRKLELELLPGPVGVVAGFRGTACVPTASEAILRAIQDEEPPAVAVFAAARSTYLAAVSELITELHWRDFEALVELMFARGGYVRVSRRGGTMESVDLEFNHPELKQTVAVQVKAEFSPQEVREFSVKQRARAPRAPDQMFFVTHSTTLPEADGVVGWNQAAVAERVVARGLADWVASRVG